MTVSLPDHPRLRRGCCTFDAEDGGLIVRSVEGAFVISAAQRRDFEPVLAKLDGRRSIARLLARQDAAPAFYALRMLANFNEAGLLLDGPADPSRAAPQPAAVHGARVSLANAGWLSSALAERLRRAGATIDRGVLGETATPGAVALAALDRPDLDLLMRLWRKAGEAGSALLACFPFGDALVVGPTFMPGRRGCPRCFELRWLGLSPTIPQERRYLERVRRGAPSGLAAETADDRSSIAALAETLVGARLGGREDPLTVTIAPWEGAPAKSGPLAPAPYCEACGEGEAPARLVAEDWRRPGLSLPDLAARLASLVDHPLGLAVTLPAAPAPSPAEAPAIVLARYALPEPETVGGGQQNWSHGCAPRREDARALALIEGLERYAGLSPPPGEIWAAYEDVAETALRPTELPLFSQRQYQTADFPFAPFQPHLPVRWSEAFNLTQGRPVLVPTASAWYGFDDSLLSECSSGVAAHSGRGEALLNGVLELIERDAFMAHWLNRLAPARVDLSADIDPESAALCSLIEANGYRLHLMEATTDLAVPVFLAIGVHEDGRKPALLLGAGASLSARTAMHRALKELYAASISPGPLWRQAPPMHAQAVVTLADHSLAYSHPDWLPNAAFLWSSERLCEPPAATQVPEGVAALDALVARLADCGHDVIGVDLTPADLAGRDLFVVRAIVPGLLPLALGPGPRLGGRRQFDAPVRMGRLARPLGEEALNFVPHCFP